uniref:Uncharacterized protein LOC114343277 n=1 Tax=Diabrotica virgifera virgifera TaxID=50390 RepID=A0A6P7GJQ7_DIAVI
MMATSDKPHPLASIGHNVTIPIPDEIIPQTNDEDVYKNATNMEYFRNYSGGHKTFLPSNFYRGSRYQPRLSNMMLDIQLDQNKVLPDAAAEKLFHKTMILCHSKCHQGRAPVRVTGACVQKRILAPLKAFWFMFFIYFLKVGRCLK